MSYFQGPGFKILAITKWRGAVHLLRQICRFWFTLKVKSQVKCRFHHFNGAEFTNEACFQLQVLVSYEALLFGWSNYNPQNYHMGNKITLIFCVWWFPLHTFWWWCLFDDTCILFELCTFINTYEAGLNQAVHVKTTCSHVALCEPNSGTVNTRELFKHSKDLASLVVCN